MVGQTTMQQVAAPAATTAATPPVPESSDATSTASSATIAFLQDARKLVTANAEVYVQRLAEAVAVPSVSTDLSKRDSCFAMADMLNRWIDELGGQCEKVLVGFQELDHGERYDLPPVLLAEFREGGRRNGKPTVLVYGHYDVQPAERDDGWTADPFKLDERDSNLYGRGASSNKGPILAWLWAVEVFKELGVPLPVNLKLCFEGMQESESECLQDLLERENKANGFLADVEYVVVTDSHWLTPSKPCLTYGLRGLSTFQCEVKAAAESVPSGHFGGCLNEAMTDVVQLLAAVSAGAHGEIQIPGCARADCGELSEAERNLYKAVTFDTAAFQKEAGGVAQLRGDSKDQVLMNRWRYPSLSIHGIEGTPATPGMKTVIPGTATGNFSLRLSPNQDASAVEAAVRKILEDKFAELASGNKLTITSSSSPGWLADPRCPLYKSGAAALLKVHGAKPDMIRGGGFLPVVNILQKVNAETMILPLGASDDGAHSHNEKMGRRNYLEAVNVLLTLMTEVEAMHSERTSGPNNITRRSRGALGRLKDIWFGLS